MLNVHSGLIIWTIITFVILLFVLGKIAWKPLMKTLQSREQGILDALNKAEQAKKDAERLLAENARLMAQANEETAKVLREGRELAERMRTDILAKGNESARAMLDQAKQEIEREKEAALTQLRDTVAELAIMAAGRLLDESLDPAKHKKIVDKILKEIPKN